MTAEIAILNKSAVALAADSYVTISTSKGHKAKTYLVNKLFTLSKYRPVGIMVYGNAELLGVPWETIIKEYRRALDDRSFDTIDKYANELIAWLSKNNKLFTEKEQRLHFLTAIAQYFQFWVKDAVDEEVKTRTAAGKKISKREINAILQVAVERHRKFLFKECKPLAYLPRNFGTRIRRQYRDQIELARTSILPGYNMTAVTVRRLTDIAVNYITRDIFPPFGTSGIVIAGFGNKEKYPVVKAFATHRIVLGKLIYRADDRNSANLNQIEPHVTHAAICPFAQREVVDAFLQGIDPHFRQVIRKYLSDVLDQWPGIISQSLPNLKAADRNTLNAKLGKAGKDILKNFEDHLKDHVRNKHIKPMLDTVSHLPKEELAAMAESLVGLTSVKRKMSLDLETVGGPVDAAVITKGDGFIWIRRKHYFESKLNPQFFANYFGREQKWQQQRQVEQ